MKKYLVVSRFNYHNEDKTLVSNDILGFTLVDVETDKVFICKTDYAQKLLDNDQLINLHKDAFGNIYSDTLRRTVYDFPVKSAVDKKLINEQYNFPTIVSNGSDGSIKAYDANGVPMKLSPYNYIPERRAFTNATVTGNRTLLGNFNVNRLNTKSPVLILYSELGKAIECLKNICI